MIALLPRRILQCYSLLLRPVEKILSVFAALMNLIGIK